MLVSATAAFLQPIAAANCTRAFLTPPPSPPPLLPPPPPPAAAAATTTTTTTATTTPWIVLAPERRRLCQFLCAAMIAGDRVKDLCRGVVSMSLLRSGERRPLVRPVAARKGRGGRARAQLSVGFIKASRLWVSIVM